jgi:hypothetical protein
MPVTSPPVGPVEWVAITFPGSGLGPEVTAPLAGLVDTKTVRVLDAVVVRKAADGTISEVEIEAESPAFDRVDGEVLELLSHDDLLAIAGRLGDDTTTLVVVWENLWAAAFAGAVRDRGGIVVAHDRVPAADVAAAVAALEDATAETAHEGSPA